MELRSGQYYRPRQYDAHIRSYRALMRQMPELEAIPGDLEEMDSSNEGLYGDSGKQPWIDRFVKRVFPIGMNTRKRTRSVVAPVAMTSSVNYDTANRTINISGREFWDNITVTATQTGSSFATQTRILRPTDAQLFSWLAGIANKFEEFKFHKLKFVYESQVSTAESGQVGIFFDGDPTHLPPANWNNFINTGANAHGAVWAKHQLNVPSWLYSSRLSYYTVNEFPDAATLNNTVLSTISTPKPTDPLEYFPGIYGWCAEGITTSTGGNVTKTLGKLYLEYNITLKTQNVDGFNITNTAGTQVSTEDVVNSGQGFYWSRAVTDGGGTTTIAFFGQDTAAITGVAGYTLTQAGTNYFKNVTIAGTTYKQSISDVVLLVTVRNYQGSGATKPTLVIAAATGPNQAPDFGTPLATQLQEVGPTQTFAGNSWNVNYQVLLKAGQYLRISSGENAVRFTVLFSPWPFLLQSGTNY